MKLLITGAGLVGAQLAELERAAGRRPVLFDVAPRLDAITDVVPLDDFDLVRGDVLDAFDLAQAVRRHDVTHIAHTAANAGLTAGAAVAPLASIRINILGTANVLEVARQLELERVVVCSSSALYASLAGGEDAGAAGMEEAYPRPTTLYATAKQAVESMAFNYREEFGLDTVAVRFGPVFGPWRAGGGGIATEAMERAVRAGIAGEEIVLEPLELEWLYSKDAARGVQLASTVPVEQLTNRVFNIGCGELVSVPDLSKAMEVVFPGAKVQVSEVESFGTSRQPMSSERARTQLGYEPAFHPIEMALTDYRAAIERQLAG